MKVMWKNQWCFVALLIIPVFFISGCGTFFSRSEEPIHTYVLSVDIPPETKVAQPKHGTLLVNLPRVQSGFNTQRMAYVTRDHELNFFAYSQWAESPAHMLLPLLVKNLERTNQWEAVVQMPSPVRGDYQLIPENLYIQHEFTQKPSRVRIHLRLQLIRIKNFHVVGTHELTILENAKSEDPYGGVQAANAATERLLKEISTWLSLCMAGPTEGTC